MPVLFRRVALLTIVSALGITLLAPLTVRSAHPAIVETQRLLQVAAAAREPQIGLDRGTLAVRDLSAARSLADLPGRVVPEVLAAVDSLPVHGSAQMEATLYNVATPPPAPVAAAPVAPFVVDGSVWDRLAQCESSGNWASNTGNGYYGGLQFGLGTWANYGGTSYAARPDLASREQQIAIAEKLYAARGFQPWPACRLKLGLP